MSIKKGQRGGFYQMTANSLRFIISSQNELFLNNGSIISSITSYEANSSVVTDESGLWCQTN